MSITCKNAFLTAVGCGIFQSFIYGDDGGKWENIDQNHR